MGTLLHPINKRQYFYKEYSHLKYWDFDVLIFHVSYHNQ
jgi:hypothetical protein